jgi:hypothetical protein
MTSARRRVAHEVMNDSLRAAVLVSGMSVEPQPIDSVVRSVPAIRRVIRHEAGPLDLDGHYFRYRVERDGGIRALPPIPGARICREKSGRGRTRSVARS